MAVHGSVPVLLILVLQVATPARAAQGQSEAKADLERVGKLLLEGPNLFRQKEGREPVKGNPELTSAAKEFAGFMARTDKYGHEADGRQPSDRAKAQGYDYCVISENIAYEFNSAGFQTEELARAFLVGWKNSEGHRKNMLDSDVLEAGMGVARSEKSGKYYAVQMFGRPKSAMIEFSIVNETESPVEYELAGEKFTVPARTTRTHGQCRAVELTFPFPQGQAKDTTFRPGRGERFVIRQEQGQLQVSKQGPSDQAETE